MNEIYLHCDELKDIDGSIDYVTYNNFIRSFHEAEKSQKTILIHANTMGGDWEAGLAIYDLINFSSCEVIMVGHGCLWSMGSVLLQAATKRYLMPHCNFMVHWGSEDISGDHLTVKTTMDYLEKESKRMIDIYTARCIRGKFFKDRGSDEEVVAKFIKAKLKTDWYMSAEEAVYYGFADKVLTKRTYNNARKAIKRTSPRTK